MVNRASPNIMDMSSGFMTISVFARWKQKGHLREMGLDNRISTMNQKLFAFTIRRAFTFFIPIRFLYSMSIINQYVVFSSRCLSCGPFFNI